MRTKRSVRVLLPTALALTAFVTVAVNTGAGPTNEGAKARVPIIEFRLRPAPNFDPADPVIIETIINASDDIPFSNEVPVDITDWIAMGPMVLIDGKFPEVGSDLARFVGVTDCYPWGKPREFPPRKAREMAFHLRDEYRIPPGWTNLWVKEDSVWISLDRRGRVVPLPLGMEWALAAGNYVSSQSATGNYEVIERLEPLSKRRTRRRRRQRMHDAVGESPQVPSESFS